MRIQNNIILALLLLICLIFGFITVRLFSNQQKLNSALLSQNIIPIESSSATTVEKKSIMAREPWAEIRSAYKDSVVQIFSHVTEFNWLEPYKSPIQKEGSGSGFFIDELGHIITNAHVVTQAISLTVQIPSLGKERMNASVVGISFDRDLALLKIDEESVEKIKKELGNIPYLKLGDSSKVSAGDKIMVLGYPLGQQFLKSTLGIVSGRENLQGRGQLFQIDAAINPGNSGGPGVNEYGEVIGIAAAGILEAQNVGYIIQVNELKVVLNELYNPPANKLVRRPFLGVFFNIGSSSLAKYLGNPDIGGCYITDVYKGSLLDKIGIKEKDMIVEVNGNPIDYYGELKPKGCEDKILLTNYVAFLPINEDVKMTIYREGVKKEFKFKLVPSKLPEIRLKFPEYEPIDYEIFGGLVVMQLTRNHILHLIMNAPTLMKYEEPKNQAEPVLVVTHVLSDSQAHRSRVFSPGSVLTQVNNMEVKTLADFRKAIKKGAESGFLTLKESNDIFAVFDMKKVIQDEMRLANIYKYQHSPVVQELIKKYIDQNEKKIRPATAA